MIKRGDPTDDGACPECGGDVATEAGETVCVDCGLVVDVQEIDHGPVSAFREGHHGGPRTHARHDRGLGSGRIGNHDAKGRNVYSARLSRMRRQNSRARISSKAERNLVLGLTEVDRIATAMGQAQSVVEAASVVLRRAQEEDLFRGRSVEAMAAGSVLAALRTSGAPFGVRDVAVYARVEESAVRNAFQVLNRDLGLPTPPPTVASHVPRIASAVDLPEDMRADAEALARDVDEAGILQGCNPAGAAAACVYVVAVRLGGTFPGITQARLARAAGTSNATIRSSARAIEESDEVGR